MKLPINSDNKTNCAEGRHRNGLGDVERAEISFSNLGL